MARLPITRTQRSLPGTSSGLRTSVDAGSVGRALSNLGAVTTDEALKWNHLHAQTKFSEAQRVASERMGKQLQEELFEARGNPETYDAIYNTALKDVKAGKPKHGLAGRFYDKWVNQSSPMWSEGVFLQSKNELLANQKNELATQEALKIQSLEETLVAARDIDGSWETAKALVSDGDFLQESGVGFEQAAKTLSQVQKFQGVQDKRAKDRFDSNRQRALADITKNTYGKDGPAYDDLNAYLASNLITSGEWETHMKLREHTFPVALDYDFYVPAKQIVRDYNSSKITGTQATAKMLPLLKDLPENVGKQLYDQVSNPIPDYLIKPDGVSGSNVIAAFYSDLRKEAKGPEELATVASNEFATDNEWSRWLSENASTATPPQVQEKLDSLLRSNMKDSLTRKITKGAFGKKVYKVTPLGSVDALRTAQGLPAQPVTTQDPGSREAFQQNLRALKGDFSAFKKYHDRYIGKYPE